MSKKDESVSNPLDILNVFKDSATSSELGAGIHERVRLISVDTDTRKDYNGNVIKKQLFLKFKKFNKNNEDIGEKEISFFLIDAAKDSCISNLHSYIAQVQELLSIYLPSEDINEKFDPLRVLLDEDDDRDEEEIAKDYKYDVIKKKVLKKSKMFKKVEDAVKEQFGELVGDKAGFESQLFRLKLEESQDEKYIQIPRFDRFVEKSSVKKEDSVLYVNK